MRRTKQEHERDLERIQELWLRGKSHRAIAEVVNREGGYTPPITRRTITNDIAAIRRGIAERMDYRLQEELARIDHLEAEYWDAWERSCEQARVEIGKTIEDGANVAQRREATVRKEDQQGDPRFLEGVRWCIERRIKILGFDAPQRHEHSGPGGKPQEVRIVDLDKEVANLSEEERAELRAIAEATLRSEAVRQSDADQSQPD